MSRSHTGAGSDEVHARVDAMALRGPLAEALAGLKERDRDVLLLVAWDSSATRRSPPSSTSRSAPSAPASTGRVA